MCAHLVAKDLSLDLDLRFVDVVGRELRPDDLRLPRLDATVKLSLVSLQNFLTARGGSPG